VRRRAFAAALAAGLLAGAAPAERPACPWESLLADSDLGLSDRHATYGWWWFEPKPGTAVEIAGRYPRARYLSFVVQDQDGLVIDAIDDAAIVPERGANPFRVGSDRRPPTGRYRVRVLTEPPPDGDRPPNTLYAGRSLKGEPNAVVLVNLRVYLADRRVSKAAGHPLWATGGVEPPELRVNVGGRPVACPAPGEARAKWRARQASVADQTRGVGAVPGAVEPVDPPRWTHSGRASGRRTNLLGPNDSTVYASAPISARYGDLLVLRWRAPTTPVETHDGAPFRAGADMRYWSLSFMHKPAGAEGFGGIRTVRSLADLEVPTLPDGTRRLVVGLNGRARPDFVPPEQWVGLPFADGTMMLREVLAAPGRARDLGRLPRGEVPADLDAYIPGGVYVEEAVLRRAPDAGLGRPRRARGGR